MNTKFRNLAIGAVVLVSVIYALSLRPVVVSGSSMQPTYGEGQYLVESTLAWRILGLNRGDVIVFGNPHNKTQIDIKRIVGLPGEDLTMGLNNITVVDPSGVARTFGSDTIVGRGSVEFFHTKLGPEDYFVLGDNRQKSDDSRSFGAVQPSDIIGRVILEL